MKYTTFIGIDVSKLTFQAALLYLKSDQIESEGSFSNNAQSFKLFKRWLKKHLGRQRFSQVVICLEHIGLYDMDLSFFRQEDLSYSHQNSMKVKRSMGISDRFLYPRNSADQYQKYKQEKLLNKLNKSFVLFAIP